jgi:hypothetical protein
MSSDPSLKGEVERVWAELDGSMFEDPADVFQEAAVQACLGPTSGLGEHPSGSSASAPPVPQFTPERVANIVARWETEANDNYELLQSAARITERVSLGGGRKPWEMSLVVEPTLSGPVLRVIHWRDPVAKTVWLVLLSECLSFN